MLCIFIAAHMGAGIHRGAQTTLNIIETVVKWSMMKYDVSNFCHT